MLRRKQPIVLKDEDIEPPQEAVPEPKAATGRRRRSTDVPLEVAEPESARPAPPPIERRGLDSLRTEYQRSLLSGVEGDNLGGFRPAKGLNTPVFRIALVVVALAAGGFAAFLALQRPAPAPSAMVQEVAIAPAPAMAKVLVASQAIAVGERLSPSSMVWQDWPESALRSEFVSDAATPEAITDLSGSVARVAFLAGEPIRREKLGKAGEGFLSSILEAGSRGVSVVVDAASASGGFVMPNDHVDVVLTRVMGEMQRSEVILSNVRVLAINARLGDTAQADDSQASGETTFADNAIATLELDPTQAQVIIAATNIGRLALMLRPTEDATEAQPAQSAAANAAIRLTSAFWRN